MTNRERCPGCGGPNDCAVERGASTCWCFTAKVSRAAIERLPESDQGQTCLCRTCAAGEGSPSEATVSVDTMMRPRR